MYNTAANPHKLYAFTADPGQAPVPRRLRKALQDWQRSTYNVMPTERSPDDPYDRETGEKLSQTK
jgi:hypothetical protein